MDSEARTVEDHLELCPGAGWGCPVYQSSDTQELPIRYCHALQTIFFMYSDVLVETLVDMYKLHGMPNSSSALTAPVK